MTRRRQPLTASDLAATCAAADDLAHHLKSSHETMFKAFTNDPGDALALALSLATLINEASALQRAIICSAQMRDHRAEILTKTATK